MVAAFFVPKAGSEVVVHHPYCLHMSVNHSWTQEFKPSLFQIFGKNFCLSSNSGDVFQTFPLVLDLLIFHKTPHVFGKTAKLFLDQHKFISIVDRCRYLEFVPDDSAIF
jgi:hypothetical protein